MNARLHKGERVVPAQMNRMGSGVEFKLNVHNNAGAQVSSGKPKQTSNGVELEVMVDRMTAKNLAKRGSQTTQALEAASNRSLVRR